LVVVLEPIEGGLGVIEQRVLLEPSATSGLLPFGAASGGQRDANVSVERHDESETRTKP
jgi:hypothetical protein